MDDDFITIEDSDDEESPFLSKTSNRQKRWSNGRCKSKTGDKITGNNNRLRKTNSTDQYCRTRKTNNVLQSKGKVETTFHETKLMGTQKRSRSSTASANIKTDYHKHAKKKKLSGNEDLDAHSSDRELNRLPKSVKELLGVALGMDTPAHDQDSDDDLPQLSLPSRLSQRSNTPVSMPSISDMGNVSDYGIDFESSDSDVPLAKIIKKRSRSSCEAGDYSISAKKACLESDRYDTHPFSESKVESENGKCSSVTSVQLPTNEVFDISSEVDLFTNDSDATQPLEGYSIQHLGKNKKFDEDDTDSDMTLPPAACEMFSAPGDLTKCSSLCSSGAESDSDATQTFSDSEYISQYNLDALKTSTSRSDHFPIEANDRSSKALDSFFADQKVSCTDQIYCNKTCKKTAEKKNKDSPSFSHLDSCKKSEKGQIGKIMAFHKNSVENKIDSADSSEDQVVLIDTSKPKVNLNLPKMERSLGGYSQEDDIVLIDSSDDEGMFQDLSQRAIDFDEDESDWCDFLDMSQEKEADVVIEVSKGKLDTRKIVDKENNILGSKSVYKSVDAKPEIQIKTLKDFGNLHDDPDQDYTRETQIDVAVKLETMESDSTVIYSVCAKSGSPDTDDAFVKLERMDDGENTERYQTESENISAMRGYYTANTQHDENYSVSDVSNNKCLFEIVKTRPMKTKQTKSVNKITVKTKDSKEMLLESKGPYETNKHINENSGGKENCNRGNLLQKNNPASDAQNLLSLLKKNIVSPVKGSQTGTLFGRLTSTRPKNFEMDDNERKYKSKMSVHEDYEIDTQVDIVNINGNLSTNKTAPVMDDKDDIVICEALDAYEHMTQIDISNNQQDRVEMNDEAYQPIEMLEDDVTDSDVSFNQASKYPGYAANQNQLNSQLKKVSLSETNEAYFEATQVDLYEKKKHVIDGNVYMQQMQPDCAVDDVHHKQTRHDIKGHPMHQIHKMSQAKSTVTTGVVSDYFQQTQVDVYNDDTQTDNFSSESNENDVYGFESETNSPDNEGIRRDKGYCARIPGNINKYPNCKKGSVAKAEVDGNICSGKCYSRQTQDDIIDCHDMGSSCRDQTKVFLKFKVCEDSAYIEPTQVDISSDDGIYDEQTQGDRLYKNVDERYLEQTQDADDDEYFQQTQIVDEDYLEQTQVDNNVHSQVDDDKVGDDDYLEQTQVDNVHSQVDDDKVGDEDYLEQTQVDNVHSQVDDDKVGDDDYLEQTQVDNVHSQVDDDKVGDEDYLEQTQVDNNVHSRVDDDKVDDDEYLEQTQVDNDVHSQVDDDKVDDDEYLEQTQVDNDVHFKQTRVDADNKDKVDDDDDEYFQQTQIADDNVHDDYLEQTQVDNNVHSQVDDDKVDDYEYLEQTQVDNDVHSQVDDKVGDEDYFVQTQVDNDVHFKQTRVDADNKDKVDDEDDEYFQQTQIADDNVHDEDYLVQTQVDNAHSQVGDDNVDDYLKQTQVDNNVHSQVDNKVDDDGYLKQTQVDNDVHFKKCQVGAYNEDDEYLKQTPVDDDNAYMENTQVDGTVDDTVYFQQTQVDDDNNVYFQQTQVDNNVYSEQTQVDDDTEEDELYFEQTQVDNENTSVDQTRANSYQQRFDDELPAINDINKSIFSVSQKINKLFGSSCDLESQNAHGTVKRHKEIKNIDNQPQNKKPAEKKEVRFKMISDKKLILISKHRKSGVKIAQTGDMSHKIETEQMKDEAQKLNEAQCSMLDKRRKHNSDGSLKDKNSINFVFPKAVDMQSVLKPVEAQDCKTKPEMKLYKIDKQRLSQKSTKSTKLYEQLDKPTDEVPKRLRHRSAETTTKKTVNVEDIWISKKSSHLVSSKQNATTCKKGKIKQQKPCKSLDDTLSISLGIYDARNQLQARMLQSTFGSMVRSTAKQHRVPTDPHPSTCSTTSDVTMPNEAEIFSKGLPIMTEIHPRTQRNQTDDDDMPVNVMSQMDLSDNKATVNETTSNDLPDQDLVINKSVLKKKDKVDLLGVDIASDKLPAVVKPKEKKRVTFRLSPLGDEVTVPGSAFSPISFDSSRLASSKVHESAPTLNYSSVFSGSGHHNINHSKDMTTSQNTSPHSAISATPQAPYVSSVAPQVIPYTSRGYQSQSPQQTVANMPDHHVAVPHRSLTNMQNGIEPEKQFTICADVLLENILKWNPKWLDEARENNKPPPVVGDRAVFPLLETYCSYEDYVNIMTPLLQLDTWESVVKEWSQHKKDRNLGRAPQLQLAIDTVQLTGDKLCTVQLYGLAVASQCKGCQIPGVNEGDLVFLRMWGLNINPNKPDFRHIDYKQLGYVQKVRPYYDPRKAHQCVAALPALSSHSLAKTNRFIAFAIDVKVRARKFQPSKDRLAELEFVANLIPTVRQYKAMVYLQRSPLIRDVLNPSNLGVFPEAPSYVDPILHKSFNKCQARAISKATYMALQPDNLPRICLLQGPPGTGKSHTIVGMITAILRESNGNARVCFCAPSNAAVNELVQRLVAHRKSSASKSALKIVRVGREETMNSEICSYGLNKLIERNVNLAIEDKRRASIPESVKKQLDVLKHRISELTKDIDKKQIAGQKEQVSKLETDLKNMKQKRVTIELECGFGKKPGDIGISPEERNRISRNILQNANVICGTLSSIGSPLLMEVFGCNDRKERGKSHFKCTIIDEATQACELDCLIPLQYGISKLVLVGDPEQLSPTVLSKEAADRNFGQSLFDRYYLHFAQKVTSPVIMLDTQYRMDAEICSFPSKHIYNNKLQTDSSVLEKVKGFPLCPYLVFDIKGGEEKSSQAGSFCNLMEADFTVQLCEFIVQTSKIIPQNIGIIAPYQKQKTVLLGSLQERNLSGIEVGTIDGFQGREKHVIVLSCVRARSASGSIGFLDNRRRMNVALTRAKYALFVVAHLKSIETSEDWEALIKDAKTRKLVVKIDDEKQWQPVFTKYLKKSRNG